jgi:Protein of unknown function (DUF3072)
MCRHADAHPSGNGRSLGGGGERVFGTRDAGYAPSMTESNTHSNEGPDEMLGAPRPQDPEDANTAEKDPGSWVTGDEPMTGAQRSYLDTLAREAGEQLSPDLNKAEASEHIDRLQTKTGRGQS